MSQEQYRKGLALNQDQQQVQVLLKKYGSNCLSYQVLNPGFKYWFFKENLGVLAYVEYGSTWIVGGDPVIDESYLHEALADFIREAKSEEKQVMFFACSENLISHFRDHHLYSYIPIGSEARLSCDLWLDKIKKSASLRYQIHRTQNKGVVIEEIKDFSSEYFQELSPKTAITS